jgi:hypothetical protein
MAKVPELGLKPPREATPASPPTPAPAWVALLSVWTGLAALALAAAVPFVPGSRDPVGELTHARPYAMADKILPVSMYLQPAAMFLGIVVFWQMRKEPRPLPDAMVIQRLQAGVGIGLAISAMVFAYLFVWWRGPGGHL